MDAFRVTDGVDAAGWTTIVAPRAVDPRMAARYVKTHVSNYVPSGYDFALWTDGSIQITDPSFPQWAVSHLPSPREIIACPPHPERDCVYEEAVVCATLERYGSPELRRLHGQVENYHRLDFPAHGGLWATTVVVWRMSPLATSVGRSWYGHIVTMSESDQMSLPVVMRMRHLSVTTLEVDLMDNPCFVWSPHET